MKEPQDDPQSIEVDAVLLVRVVEGAEDRPGDVARIRRSVSWGPLVFSAITGGTQSQHWRGVGVEVY